MIVPDLKDEFGWELFIAATTTPQDELDLLELGEQVALDLFFENFPTATARSAGEVSQ